MTKRGIDMRQKEVSRLRGVDLVFLSSNPEQHTGLITYLKDREDRIQIFRTLEITGNPDVILIDATFSYFSIFKFLKELQLQQSTACILLVGPELSANKMSALLRSGVFDYLKIPFPLNRLEKSIRKGLKNRENLLKVLALSEKLEVTNHSLSRERDQLQKWNNDLSELYALNQKLSESLNIDEVIQTSITNIKKVVPHDISCLFLKGWKDTRVDADRKKWGGVIDQLREETRRDGLEFIQKESFFAQAAVCKDGSEILVSLTVGAAKVGLLRLIRMRSPSKNNNLKKIRSNWKKSKESFTEYQSKILSMISAPLAIAIRNAEMYKQVEELVVKDALTDVLNRRAYSGILEREFRRANRYDSPLALIVIDIDHFKKVNDSHGHCAGDQVLREMATIFKGSLRDVDVLIRYGGEEFVVILPGTNLKEGLIVSSRIKDRVEKNIFYKDVAPLHLTVSIGVANYPSRSIQTPAQLFDQADQALYIAKNNGRNRIMILKPLNESDRDKVLAFDGSGIL